MPRRDLRARRLRAELACLDDHRRAGGRLLVDGIPAFPITISSRPALGSTAPDGGDALGELSRAGVGFIRVGPTGTVWTARRIERVRQSDAAAAAPGLRTVDLRERGALPSGCSRTSSRPCVVTGRWRSGKARANPAGTGPRSPVFPALTRRARADDRALASSDATTEMLQRRVGSSIWVFAARRGTGTATVTQRGLPRGLDHGSVYGEGRRIALHDGALTDSFDRWDVRVYRLIVAAGRLERRGGTHGDASARIELRGHAQRARFER